MSDDQAFFLRGGSNTHWLAFFPFFSLTLTITSLPGNRNVKFTVVCWFALSCSPRMRVKARHVQELMHEQDQQVGVESEDGLSSAALMSSAAVLDSDVPSASLASGSAAAAAAAAASASTLSAAAAAFQPTASLGGVGRAVSEGNALIGSAASSSATLSRSRSTGTNGSLEFSPTSTSDSAASQGPTVCHLALSSDTPVEACTLKLHVILRYALMFDSHSFERVMNTISICVDVIAWSQ
jgi:hypothetical protein